MPKRPVGSDCRSASGTSNLLAVVCVCVCVRDRHMKVCQAQALPCTHAHTLAPHARTKLACMHARTHARTQSQVWHTCVHVSRSQAHACTGASAVHAQSSCRIPARVLRAIVRPRPGSVAMAAVARAATTTLAARRSLQAVRSGCSCLPLRPACVRRGGRCRRFFLRARV